MSDFRCDPCRQQSPPKFSNLLIDEYCQHTSQRPKIVEPEMLTDQYREIESLKQKLAKTERDRQALMNIRNELSAECLRAKLERDEFKKNLLESQAREMRLREALSNLLKPLRARCIGCDIGETCEGEWEHKNSATGNSNCENAELSRPIYSANAALNQPMPSIADVNEGGNERTL